MNTNATFLAPSSEAPETTSKELDKELLIEKLREFHYS